MTQPLRKLLGSQLVRNGRFLDELPPQTTVALYFADVSTSDGQEFNSRLLEFYEEMKRTNRKFEIVLIPLEESTKLLTSSASHKSFFTFHGEDARVKEDYLIRKYEVQESSTVILMNSTSASVINFKGKEKILEDPKGIDFPFKHRLYSQILSSGPLIRMKKSSSTTTSSPLTPVTVTSPSSSQMSSSSTSSLSSSLSASSSGNVSMETASPTSRESSLTTTNFIVHADQNKNDFKGFFFGAYWCPPCRTFTSTLIEVYNRVRKEGRNFQVIFISSDRSKESFERFFSSMPWLAVPYENEEGRQELTEYFNIKAIPSLIIVDDQTEKIITAEGRLEINEDLEALDFPWYPKLVEELRDRHSAILNSTLCVIYFLGDDDSEYEKAESILHPIATQIAESDIEEVFQPRFFIGTDSELAESLRHFIDLEDSTPYIVILEIARLRYVTLATVQVLDHRHLFEYLEKFQNSKLKYSFLDGHGFIHK